MSSPVAKRGTNGRQEILRCPNVDSCSVTQAAADALILIDSRLNKIEKRQKLQSAQFNEMALHISEVGERQTKADQREASWLKTLEAIERSVAALLPKEVQGA